jgi:hypothetical protein
MKTGAWITAACMLATSPLLGAQSLAGQAPGIAPDVTNTTITSEVDLDTDPVGHESWTNMGFALEGVAGEPILSGSGSALSNAACGIELVDARPLTLALLMVSAFNNPTPFKGGVLVPTPAPIQLMMITDGKGGIQIGFDWPEQIPGGMDIYMQFVILDPAAVQMFSLSNALVAHTP